MITVYRIPIPKAKFRLISADERALVLVAGHLLNQISVFVKLLRFSMSKDPADEIEGRVSAAQSQIILRCLIGVLAEGWEYVRRPANQKIIGAYLPTLSDDGQKAYGSLKKSFGRSGLLHKLRNSFLYHYPTTDQVEQAFEWIPDDEDWDWYFSKANTNSFYFSSELAFGYGVMKATGEPTHMGAFGVVMQEATRAADNMPDFLMTLIGAIVTKHLGADVLKPRPGMTIKDAVKLDKFWIPVYAETKHD